jgi:hypothetical protein
MSTQGDHNGYLLPEHRQALSVGIENAFEEYQRYAITFRSFKNQTSTDHTNTLRGMLHGNLSQAFTNIADVDVRPVGTVWVIRVIGICKLHLKKARSPNTIVDIPNTLARLCDETQAGGQPFPGWENLFQQNNGVERILSGLYIVDSGVPIGFYINDQQDGIIISSESIPLATPTPQWSDTNEETSGIPFEFKVDENANSEVVNGIDASDMDTIEDDGLSDDHHNDIDDDNNMEDSALDAG